MGNSNFWHRIRRLYRRVVDHRLVRPLRQPTRPVQQPTMRQPVVSPQPVVPAPVAPPETGGTDMATIIGMIVDAGRRQLVLQITYDGTTRLVEPYSFRERLTGRLFYGYCSVHGKIHSFRPEKISKCEVTNVQFAPRWEIEL